MRNNVKILDRVFSSDSDQYEKSCHKKVRKSLDNDQDNNMARWRAAVHIHIYPTEGFTWYRSRWNIELSFRQTPHCMIRKDKNGNSSFQTVNIQNMNIASPVKHYSSTSNSTVFKKELVVNVVLQCFFS